jgi:hypothetical protein
MYFQEVLVKTRDKFVCCCSWSSSSVNLMERDFDSKRRLILQVQLYPKLVEKL